MQAASLVIKFNSNLIICKPHNKIVNLCDNSSINSTCQQHNPTPRIYYYLISYDGMGHMYLQAFNAVFPPGLLTPTRRLDRSVLIS